MKLLNLTLASPADNLACEEALLDWSEAGAGEEILRFWESPAYFVVVGYANKVAAEVKLAACETRRIPVYRRYSGGGTVLQGPGCLNYALILRITEDGPFRNISTTNQFIMRRHRAALESVLHRPVAVRGHTDLALGERKCSGNSQRRHRHYLLFHGTFLLNFELSLISEVLPMPSKEPDYREGRSHAGFLTNLDVPTAAVKAALCQAWHADQPLLNPPLELAASLARQKYTTREWNFKF